MKGMTLLDVIETYNLFSGRDLDDVGAMYKDIDIDSRLDKDILIGCILDECGAMTVLYEKTSTFKYFSDNFFKKYKFNISKLIDSMELKYDPLANKRYSWSETTNIEQNLDTSEEKGESRTRTNTGTQQTDNSGTEGSISTIAENSTGGSSESKFNTGTQTTDASNENTAINSDNKTKTNTGTQNIEKASAEENTNSEKETNTISAMNASTYQPDTEKTTNGTNNKTNSADELRTDNLSESITGGSTESTSGASNEIRTDNLAEIKSGSQNGTKTTDSSGTVSDNSTEIRTDNLLESISASNDRNKNEDLTWNETDVHTEDGSDNVVFQELIEKERKIAQFNIYNWIVKKYAKELFLLVY